MIRALSLLAALSLPPSAEAFQAPAPGLAHAEQDMDQTIQAVEQMVWNDRAQRLAADNGLSLVNVTWEDTGRSSGSAVGPNISDMTIGVRDSQGLLHPMPVFRFDNFTDTTADLASDRFYLPVGNAKGTPLRSVSLAHVLQYTSTFLSKPRSWAGAGPKSLWSERDVEVLVSAQACFLPVPKAGEATFTPVIYNYQSLPGDPAVLTIVATREGTSIQVVQNEGGYLSEPLFFNSEGQRAPFTAARMSDYLGGGAQSGTSGAISANGEDGLSTVMVIQVPLKQKAAPQRSFGWGSLADGAPALEEQVKTRGDTEDAVIGHGDTEGPFAELDGLSIERDPRFPVRVTVQMYKATSTGEVSAQDVAELRSRIDRIYRDASYVGSLVTEAPSGRTTDWRQPKQTESSWALETWFRTM